ncbi:MAG: PhzF family phenazine biosynthesis protein [Bacteroidota bacterium]
MPDTSYYWVSHQPESMTIPVYQVDAFTDELFKGNPAAVCPLEEWLPNDVLQQIAAENNLSETAFFVKKDVDFELRWFTPTVEVALCGHATLASAHVLFEHLEYTQPGIHFHTAESGTLNVSKSKDGLCMDLPVDNPVEATPPPALFRALGIDETPCYKGETDYLIVLQDQLSLDKIKPDFRALAKIEARGIIVTAPGENHDFVSRFFCPQVGIDEDPVTGSAHTTLVPYWSTKLNRSNMTAQQRSKRAGELICKLNNDRVLLTGKAVTYLSGQINIQ